MDKIKAEYYDKGFWFTLGAAQALCVFCFCIAIVMIGFNIFNIATDDTDYSGFNRSGISLHTDAKTGLQYLSKGNTLIPRLNKDGYHMYINIID